jgi:hypothetical protein
MKRNITATKSAGYSLVEISIALLVFVVVGALVYAMLLASTSLLAKNLSVNSSNTLVRSTLDRIYSDINQANGAPILVNADGTLTGSTAPAAGVLFDRYVGGPFIVGNPGSGLPWNTTSFKLYYSTDPMASPVTPVRNDVVVMDGVTRALVSSCSAPSGTYASPIPSPTPVAGKMVTVTLQNNLGTYTNPPVTSGTAIAWLSNVQQTAYVLHRKAFIVVPINGRGELRMYRDAETVTNFNDPNSYVVLSSSVGTETKDAAPENLPFSLVTQNGATFLSIAMRVEDQQFNNYLKSRYIPTNQAREFNTFLRVDAMMRPRNFLH